MNGFIAFFKKEWLEAIRTKRILILFIAFAILGILGPLMTILTPYILESTFPDGVIVQIPEPSAIDAFASFFKNISQMGTIILLLLFGGMLSNDVQKQALIPLLTKGLSRRSIVFAKLAINYILWTCAYLICFFISYSYTIYYWDISIVSNLSLSVFGVWLCGIFLITILMFFSTLFLSFSGTLLGTFSVIGILLILPLFEVTNRFNPLLLYNQASALLTSISLTDTYWQVGSTVVIIIILINLSIIIFNKKRI